MPPVSKRARTALSVVAILFGAILAQLSLGIHSVLLPVTMQRRGAGTMMIGICLSLDMLAAVILTKHVPAILSRLSLAGALYIAGLVRTAMLIMLSLTSDYRVWPAIMFGYGCGTYVLIMSLQTWLSMVDVGRYQGLVVGLYSSMLSLGVALGPIVIRFCGVDGKLAFHLNSAAGAVTVIPFLLLKPWIPRVMSKKAPRVVFLIRMAPAVMGSALVGGIAFWGLPAFLTLFGIQSGLALDRASYLITTFMLGSIVLGPAVSLASDLAGRGVVITLCVFVGLLCAVYLPIAVYEYSYALALLFVWGGMMGGIYSVALAELGMIFPEEHKIGANAVYSLMDILGGITGLVLMGALMDAMGPEGLVYVIVAAAVVYFIYLLSLRHVE